jgi:hypothetical protein
MSTATRRPLVTLEDYDRAIGAQDPGEEGLSRGTRLARFISLKHLHEGRAKVWDDLADRYANDLKDPWELVAAARRCAGHDREESKFWEEHHDGVARQQRGGR